jgi:3-mercaptopyruvate sulfurtransferase SseA
VNLARKPIEHDNHRLPHKSNKQTLLSSTVSYIIQDAFDTPEYVEESEDSSSIEASPKLKALNENVEVKQPQIKWLTSSELIEFIAYLNKQIGKVNFRIIDTRNSNEYNGWKSIHEPSKTNTNHSGLFTLYDTKNGRIQNAHNFDADWLHLFEPNLLDNLVVERLNIQLRKTSKVSDVEEPIILYDTIKMRLEKVKNYLVENFAVNSIYLCQLKEDNISRLLSTNNQAESNLFFQEPFYDMLLSAEVLNMILSPFNDTYVLNVKPITEYKLFDVSQGDADKHYVSSHIPTAVHMNTFDFEDSNFVRKNRTELARVLLDYGIFPNNSEMIILYGNPDPMASFRAAILMKWMGVKNVHVLNGGYRSWMIKNFPIEQYTTKRVPIKHDTSMFLRKYEEQSIASQQPINYIVDRNYIADILNNHEVFLEHYSIVDVRTFEEHNGETSGYTKLKSKGKIPKSLWGRAGSTPDQLEDYRNPDLTMRSGIEILKMWDELGVDYKKKHLIFYCGNGWRAAEVMFYAEMMGLYKISMYDRGWMDWSSDLNNPIEIDSNITKKPITTEKIEDKSTSTSTISTSTTSQTTNQTSSKSSKVSKQQQHTQSQTQFQSQTQTQTSLASKTQTFPFMTNKYNQNKFRTTPNLTDWYYKNQFDLVTATRSNSFGIYSNILFTCLCLCGSFLSSKFY